MDRAREKEGKGYNFDGSDSDLQVSTAGTKTSRAGGGGKSSEAASTRTSSLRSYSRQQSLPRRLIQYPPPPSKGGITVTSEDLECLRDGEFLNDVIIDFYLKYLQQERADQEVASRSHIFSSFFYKQLTRKDNISEEERRNITQYRRHRRVKTWTRHVDIFSKDFLFIPLLEFCSDAGSSVNPAQQESRAPCILIMDSLKLSYHLRIYTLLREYLQVEWEVRRGTPRTFNDNSIKGSHCKVPLQDNSSDCGLYLLQYVESFLQNPVVHFDLPLRLERWFPRQQVRRKREELRDLVLQLYRRQLFRHSEESISDCTLLIPYIPAVQVHYY
uniref:Ubiquitin-like protease family profile domain-containing protein n=1 Tax=Astyanax mexicanus TaxID=7994 RepID=A0A8B9R6L4_ASTMX